GSFFVTYSLPFILHLTQGCQTFPVTQAISSAKFYINPTKTKDFAPGEAIAGYSCFNRGEYAGSQG
ncbi:MAG: hypothetical protein AAGA67_01320, partial [Cyanobacteria bacterium P01_F01_bin.153]